MIIYSNLDVAKTILQQLGGNKFLAMTGAKNLVYDNMSLRFSVPNAKNKINLVEIKLMPDDTYTMKFNRFYKLQITEIAVKERVMANELQSTFTAETGLDTHL